MDSTGERQMLAFFLPEGTLAYFELVGGTKTAHAIHLVLEEKNHPPLGDGKRVTSIMQTGRNCWRRIGSSW